MRELGDMSGPVVWCWMHWKLVAVGASGKTDPRTAGKQCGSAAAMGMWVDSGRCLGRTAIGARLLPNDPA